MDADSVGLIVTSIPFSTQYEYSPSYNDFGHNEDNATFWAQMDFLTPELVRVLQPGRVAAIHVKDRIVPGGINKLGFRTLHPFHAEAIEHYTRHGLAFLGMVTVVTDVVRENNQTYRLGYSEQCKDGSPMGVGVPEYVLLLRKPPTDRSNGYADEPVVKDKAEYSLGRWQVDAHGFWRSNGDRHLGPEDLAGLTHAQMFRLFRDHNLARLRLRGPRRARRPPARGGQAARRLHAAAAAVVAPGRLDRRRPDADAEHDPGAEGQGAAPLPAAVRHRRAADPPLLERGRRRARPVRRDCKLTTRSLARALQHCEEASGDYPAAEHVLHELPSAEDKVARNRARRVIACRDEDGRALNARVYRSGWRFIDGRWEIGGDRDREGGSVKPARLKRKKKAETVFRCKDCGGWVKRAHEGDGFCRPCSQRRNANRSSGPARSGEIRACEVCGAERYFTPHELARGARFCSQACMGKAARKQRTCPVCGVTFEALRIPRKACSPGCRGKLIAAAKRGKRNPRALPGTSTAGEWKASREEACRSCRDRANLVLHHVVYEQHVRREHGDIRDPANSLTLCVKCHVDHHSSAGVRLRISMLRGENLRFAFNLLGPAALDYFRRYYDVDDQESLTVRLEAYPEEVEEAV
jgi:hypothetical protein